MRVPGFGGSLGGVGPQESLVIGFSVLLEWVRFDDTVSGREMPVGGERLVKAICRWCGAVGILRQCPMLCMTKLKMRVNSRDYPVTCLGPSESEDFDGIDGSRVAALSAAIGPLWDSETFVGQRRVAMAACEGAETVHHE